MNLSSPAVPRDTSDTSISLGGESRFNFGQFVSRSFNFLYVIASFCLVIFVPFEVNKWSVGARILWLMGAAALNFGLVQGFKYLCYMPRPHAKDCFCWGRRAHSGFPSGHTLPAFMFATMIKQAYPNLWFWFAGALLIGWARWSVKAHYGYQVTVSAMIGIGLGLLVGRFL